MNFINALKKNLPKTIIIDDSAYLKTFECDGLAAYKQTPLVVTLPETIPQIKTILKLCRQYQVPIVTRGAGTGLSGGATPIENCLVLGLSKLTKILNIDPKSLTITVQSGVRNLAVSEAVAEFGLYYGPDPSSQIACTIGGNLAENSGGVHCLKYGLTVHNVWSATILTIEGELLTFNYDDDLGLLALIIGSEGLLGIIVEVTLKLIPKPQHTELIMASFNSVEKCADAVAGIITTGVIPAGLEMMDKLAISAAEAFAKAGYPLDAEALLLCEVDGSKLDVELELVAVKKVLADFGADTIKIAQDKTERLQLWQGRKSAFPAVGRLSPDYYCIDGTIPKHKLAQILRQITEFSQKYQLRVANVFHAGDGNLHPLILYDKEIAGDLAKAEAFASDILLACINAAGTITGEHGVGIEKINSMCSQFNSQELAQFHEIKQIFDPENLLNPGKAIPTLHHCAEFGKMHVHNNQLPFPELDRF